MEPCYALSQSLTHALFYLFDPKRKRLKREGAVRRGEEVGRRRQVRGATDGTPEEAETGKICNEGENYSLETRLYCVSHGVSGGSDDATDVVQPSAGPRDEWPAGPCPWP